MSNEKNERPVRGPARIQESLPQTVDVSDPAAVREVEQTASKALGKPAKVMIDESTGEARIGGFIRD